MTTRKSDKVGGTDITRGTCRTVCPNGYFYDNSTLTDIQCTKCNSPCGTCEGSGDKCISCDGTNELSYVWLNKCYKDCPNETAPDMSTLKCIGCGPNCNKCGTLEGNSCYECMKGWLLENGTCVE